MSILAGIITGFLIWVIAVAVSASMLGSRHDKVKADAQRR